MERTVAVERDGSEVRMDLGGMRVHISHVEIAERETSGWCETHVFDSAEAALNAYTQAATLFETPVVDLEPFANLVISAVSTSPGIIC